ncbi:hypothetical protein [Flavobacterium caeni]|uniref:Uncharacterized protein n=1 Tax=Flavobacterium caeni TaxID=490189 RepID=A0A1G5GXI7_9FLAO|nr:hypothetical protein [Flavobacterium caeni]SCY56107.1 hypothetical protein SAMN02927903_01666 [Flavobacterium caeni]
MKKLTLILLLGIGLSANAQAPKIELYDLMSSLIPAQGQTAWAQTGQLNPKLKFSKKKIDSFTKKHTQSAAAVVAVQGETIDCGGKKTCTWDVELSGNAKSVNQFVISSGLSNDLMDMDESTDYTNPKFLFKGKKVESKVFKDCEDGNVFYELKFPGKVPVWMKIYTEGGAHGVSLWIECYLDKKDIQCF